MDEQDYLDFLARKIEAGEITQEEADEALGVLQATDFLTAPPQTQTTTEQVEAINTPRPSFFELQEQVQAVDSTADPSLQDALNRVRDRNIQHSMQDLGDREIQLEQQSIQDYLDQMTEAYSDLPQRERIDTTEQEQRMREGVAQPGPIPQEELLPRIQQVFDRVEQIQEANPEAVDLTTNYGGYNDAALMELGSEGALRELAARQRIRDSNFEQNSQNPEYWDRLRRTIGASIPRTANAIYSLPDIARFVMSEDPANLEDFLSRDESINRAVGVSEPIGIAESAMEAVPGLLFPGGAVARGVGFGTDLLLDQSIRELTDTEETPYQTVFDQLRLTDDGEMPNIGPAAAIVGGLFAGSLGASAVTRMVQSTVPDVPQARQLREFMVGAPEDLETIERSTDLNRAAIVDEQAALTGLAERAGVPNLRDIEDRIEFDSGAAMNTRVQEAVRTGRMSVRGGGSDFETEVAPAVLYEQARQLDPNTRRDVNDYINMQDMLDDARIALREGIGDRQTNLDTVARITAQSSTIRQRTPQAVEISQQYNTVSRSVRDFLEGELFSPEFRRELDRDRPNYVSLEVSDVLPSSPLGERLAQAQRSGEHVEAEDWFLRRRDSVGNYDLQRRSDPFDMMMRYTEAALTSRLKNDTRKAYIDQMRQSQYGSNTIRPVREGEAGEFPRRIVTVHRNGKKEQYISSQLQADLLRFDPYIAKHPIMHSMRRVFEQTTTGPLTATFAVTTALRDMVAGAILRPEGINTVGPLGMGQAFVNQLYAKAQGAISRRLLASLNNGASPIPQALMSRAQQQRLAANMADGYVQSLYHLANTQGGFDASLMKNKIELSQGMLTEIKDTITQSGLVNNPLVNNGLTRFSAETVSTAINGFIAVFDAMQDAPRFGAIQASVKNGLDVDEATQGARSITGDVTKSGRAVRPDGSYIEADAVDQGVNNILSRYSSWGVEAVRESTPFLNPMIQGTRRLLASYIDDPIGTNLRAWAYVGIPAIAAYTWNEMLGEEYNDYAITRRSARDVAMNMYIGVPSLPPEQGIEIPLAHEILSYHAPFIRSLYGISRGEAGSQTSAALMQLGNTIFSNSLEVGYPVIGQAAFNVAGVNAPDAITGTGVGSAYMISEDNLGFLPQNIETLTRTLFGSVGDIAIEGAYALNSSGGDFGAFQEQVYNEYMRRAPIVHNLTGRQEPGSPFFTMPAQFNRERRDAIEQFRDLYDEFYNPKRFTENSEQKPSSSRTYTSDNFGLENEDLPFQMIGPTAMARPANPLIARFGERVREALQTNERGISGINNRLTRYNQYLRRLRNYNAGDAEALQGWQRTLEMDDPVKELLERNDVDISNYHDRVRIMNIIANEMSYLFAAQDSVYTDFENELTEELQAEGTFPPGMRFDVRLHLQPDFTP
jgi:hypothetical protein